MIHSPALRVGIIGSNYGLAHIAPLRAAGATVVALAGRDPSKTATLAAQHQIALATTDIDQLCQAVDAVVIASPDGLHHQHVLQVLGHGRHILCEKPLTRTASDAEALVAAAAQAKVVCATAFAYRHIGVLRQLHNWLRQRPAPHWLSISVANSFASAAEAANVILSIDETVKLCQHFSISMDKMGIGSLFFPLLIDCGI